MPSTPPLRIALIGDFDPQITAHQAIPLALELAARHIERDVQWQWLATESIAADSEFSHFDGLWCVPGSPYRSTDGALRAIAFARARQRPFLGTCGGFQHAVLEYARNVLGWADAEHGETAPEAARAVISPLTCALVEAIDQIQLVEGSLIAKAYASKQISEGYRCRYGVNPAFIDALLSHDLRVSGQDAGGEPRAIELNGHPFFVATLFQPERAALRGLLPPLVAAFVEACARNQR